MKKRILFIPAITAWLLLHPIAGLVFIITWVPFGAKPAYWINDNLVKRLQNYMDNLGVLE